MPEPLAGTWGICHGSGFLGSAIRQAELDTSKSTRFPDGDRDASWAGHAIVAIGGGNVVEATWPEVAVSPLTKHADAIWATGQPLTQEQRAKGTAAVLGLVGGHYDWPSYIYFLAKVAQVTVSKDLAPLFAATAKLGPICSGVVVRELEAMGVPLGPMRTAAVQDPDFISPADLLRFALDNGWTDRPVPGW